MTALSMYVVLIQDIEAVLGTDLDASTKCKSIEMLIEGVRDEDEVIHVSR